MKIPRSFTPTHQTEGLPGFPAIDLFATAGTKIQAPEAGVITRISGHDPEQPPPLGQGGPWGLSIYYHGSSSGNVYYMTHLSQVAKPGVYRDNDTIGVIGNYPSNAPGADHVHLGLHTGDSPEAHYASVLFPARCYLSAAPPGPPVFKPTKAWWQWLNQFLKRGKWTHPA